MALPTFVGIGAQRSGTTWLHQLLISHPDVYMPRYHKEIHFFDMYFERGLQWYERFFPSNGQAAHYRAIGEITPRYLSYPACAERIARIPSIAKLILILRNPIDRAYSGYSLEVRNRNYSGSFEDFLASGYGIKHGYYSQHLQNYLSYFQMDQILVLIFDQAVADVPETKKALACFLNIAADRFPPTAGLNRVNTGHLPKARLAYTWVLRMAEGLRRRDMDWVVDLANRLGIERLFGKGQALPPMKEETRQYLRELYADEITDLESLLQIDLESWR